jgi:RNA polymerase sigma factor (TIGR02999 family)
MEVAPQEVTHLLLAWSDGDPAALEKLVPLVRARLRHLARRYMREERRGHILQTTALINEAYLRLIDWKHVSWKNRAHFFGVSAKLMRHILVDLARQRPRLNGGAEARRFSLDEALVMCKEKSRDLVAADDVAMQEAAWRSEWMSSGCSGASWRAAVAWAVLLRPKLAAVVGVPPRGL